MNDITTLGEIADIGLGFKSLQNDFFYITPDIVATFGIEAKFVSPIFMIRDFDAGKYLQNPSPRLLVFSCNDDEKDLKKTGALKYIRTMAARTANKKKQSKSNETIEQVLAKQGGKHWYGPKALRFASRIWLRKAMGGVFAPYLSKQPIVVDQRCNYVVPKSGLTNDELAALLTSSVAAFSIEVNGSFSMGAGALEAPTSKIRDYPMPDIRAWNKADRKELATIGSRVWKSEAPVDWSVGLRPNKELRRLDTFILSRMRGEIGAEVLYRDLAVTIAARHRLASSKTGSQIKKRSESVRSVAEGVAESVRELFVLKPYPEGFFAPEGEGVDTFDTSGHSVVTVQTHPMMGQTEIDIAFAGMKDSLQLSVQRDVGEIIVRALLLGRSKFAYPTEEEVAREVIADSKAWLASIAAKIEDLVSKSSSGSGYEGSVTTQVLEMLGIHRAAFEDHLPSTIAFEEKLV
jgi:hypothetical protein